MTLYLKMKKGKPIGEMINALTIDVEDYFQINAFSDVIRYKDWDTFESRVEKNTYKILDLLDSVNPGSQFTVHSSDISKNNSVNSSNIMNPINTSNTSNSFSSNKSCQSCLTKGSTKATFFVLGWIAERFPSLVKEIHSRGHEVACHGYSHKLIFNQTQEEFRNDVKRAKELLEDITGEKVFGYRAPTYSITKKTMWALEILYELGFKYDSSIFPIKHDVYGMTESPRFPYVITFNDTPEKAGIQHSRHSGQRAGIHFFDLNSSNDNNMSITEIPISTVRMFKNNIPVAGGGYFRLFPYLLTKYFLNRINKSDGKPFVFYLHPWEIDPDIPKINNASLFSRFRTYVNLDKAFYRFKRLLSDFHFTTLSNLLLFPINGIF